MEEEERWRVSGVRTWSIRRWVGGGERKRGFRGGGSSKGRRNTPNLRKLLQLRVSTLCNMPVDPNCQQATVFANDPAEGAAGNNVILVCCSAGALMLPGMRCANEACAEPGHCPGAARRREEVRSVQSRLLLLAGVPEGGVAEAQEVLQEVVVGSQSRRIVVIGTVAC